MPAWIGIGCSPSGAPTSSLNPCRQCWRGWGAAAFDLSQTVPLTHLTFTQGAALLEESFYRTQVEEVRAYAAALLAAERHERGFGWKPVFEAILEQGPQSLPASAVVASQRIASPRHSYEVQHSNRMPPSEQATCVTASAYSAAASAFSISWSAWGE